MKQRSPALEPTLLWIVTGYRIFAAVWLSILGGVALGSETTRVERPSVVIGTIVLALIWAGLTTALRIVRPALASTWWLVAIDMLISCWTVVAGEFAGTIQFAGGYPLVGALTAIYAYGWVGGAVGAAALTATGLVRVVGGEQSVPQDVANSIAYLFSVGAAAGVAAILRTSDRRRAAAEEALERERTERIRAEEHAEMAAHLHDSVLQTLVLIQRDSAATPDIRGLARHQERELRAWLFPEQGGNAAASGGFKEALVAVCSEIEDLGAARVETVVVGDSTAAVEPIVRAAREAILNASKYSGADTIAVYGEANTDEVLVFVKDRGIGFDPAAVPESRQGIRESIVSRMERHGGSAEIVSEPGAGTEVRLRLPLGEA
ncbi:MAG: ATP-binding protein [Acidimicrobiia bacterium]|nr:ATP-binding protein [Acidimicrobiia bacterium]